MFLNIVVSPWEQYPGAVRASWKSSSIRDFVTRERAEITRVFVLLLLVRGIPSMLVAGVRQDKIGLLKI